MSAGPSKPDRSVKAAGPAVSPQVTTGSTVDSDVTAAASASPGPGQVLALQSAIGNAAVNQLMRRPSSEGGVSTARPVTLALGGPARVQRVREAEFQASPPRFLRENRVTVDMAKGLRLRYPDPNLHKNYYEAFVGAMDAYRFSRHWFVLQPNPDDGTYIVTPAIEKYIEYDPKWAEHIEPKLLAVVKKGAAGPPAKEYISAAYFPYYFGKPSTTDFGGTMGHTDLVKKPGKGEGPADFNPDFAFTGFMNGCALTVTPVPQDPSKFTIWHFQSSTAFKQQATTFRMEYKPVDWFGEDEYYPRGIEPPGTIPKVTNLLYRGRGGWHVASQVNYTESETGLTTRGEPPVSRALDVEGGGDPLPKLKAIYVDGMQTYFNVHLRRAFEVCRQHQAAIKGDQAEGIAVQFENCATTVEQILDEEEKKLKAATDAVGLRAVALGIGRNRKQNDEIVNGALTSLHRYFVYMEEQESKKSWPWKSETRRAAYAGMRARLEEIRPWYNEITTTIGELIRETTPQPSSGEGSMVAAPEIPPGSASPGTERESGGQSEGSELPASSSGMPAVGPTAMGPVPAVAPERDGLYTFLDERNPQWNVAANGGGDQGMIVAQGRGVMAADASRREVAGPVPGESLPAHVQFLRNDGNGAWCFVYSIVMGLTGRPQSEVEGLVRYIAHTAGVPMGWIAADTDEARRVLDVVQHVFGLAVQVIEVQNSATGFVISGRSHNVTSQTRRPVVLRNTGEHYDAIV